MIDNLRSLKPIYLATPYTKYAQGIYFAYEDAAILAAKLITRGFNVYSPIVHSHPIATIGGISPLDHSIWLPLNNIMIECCPALLIGKLDGWDESYGVAHEIGMFKAACKPIFAVDQNTLEIVSHE